MIVARSSLALAIAALVSRHGFGRWPAVLALLLLPAEAAAHAQLLTATPSAGTIVAEAPGEVVLTFNEPIAALQSRWFLPDGTALEVDARSVGERLVVQAPDGLPEGTQTVSWRVVSSDGHPVGGAHVFSIGVATDAAPVVQAAPAVPAAVTRGLLTLGLAFGVGGVLWAALAGREPGRVARTLAWACLPAAGFLLASQAMDLAGGGVEVLADGAAWWTALVSPFGRAALLAALAGLIAALASPAWAGWWRPMAFVAWGLAALSFAVAGHAARAEPVALMGTLIFFHAAAMLFWAGALPGLILALRGAGALEAMQRFSRLAVPFVLLLVASGVVLAVRQVETLAALAGTAYGWLLVTKLVLAAAVLALAARHKLVLTPALATGTAPARATFARSIRIEAALMVAILVLTAGFRLTPPPRALPSQPEARVELHMHSPMAMADIAVLPGRTGPNRIEIRPMDGTFSPMRPLAITLFLSQPAGGVEAIELVAEPGEDGLWHAGPVHLPLAGEWDLVLDMLIDDFHKALIGAPLPIQP
jgi:copper transport protein